MPPQQPSPHFRIPICTHNPPPLPQPFPPHPSPPPTCRHSDSSGTLMISGSVCAGSRRKVPCEYMRMQQPGCLLPALPLRCAAAACDTKASCSTGMWRAGSYTISRCLPLSITQLEGKGGEGETRERRVRKVDQHKQTNNVTCK